MLIVTTNDAPGHRVVKTLGVVRGITVRSRNAISDMVGGVQSVFGGRIGVYVKLAETARQEAYDELVAHAREMGANAILAMRYDANEIMPGITEVLAYGTAVVIEPEA
ncbi:MAG: YbjQ family protein [Brevundimonas sp.]|uniref:YbjQ family protein n=1 Tax=Brevundimonas sp. TaxID=1871086 RepID=UPI002488F8FB|nr:YbjQ family protein [Brevundimonas sp.]MDI1327467.1 YbjQ family protein [Brevundimonas sp.]